MLYYLAFVILSTSLYKGTVSYEDCIQRNFEPRACRDSKNMWEAGKKLCELQGKDFDGKSTCK
jgi:hypothetical protein